MARIRVFRTCVFVVAILLWLPSVLLAQGTASSLSGVVTDASGAVIPGAAVTVTNIGTNVAKTVHTDGVGHYLVTDLTPGSYSLLVDAAGFEGKKVSAIQLVVAQESRQDVALAVGGNTQVVTVESTAITTETETSSVGAAIPTQQVVDIPLDTRTFFSLPLLSPEVSQPAANSQTGYRGGFSVSGQDEIANNFIIDGYDSNDRAVSVPNFRPSIEAVQEFRLLTGIYPAEFGRVPGGQVIIQQKTGTNKYNGDVFLFVYNTVANAHPFVFPNTTSLPNTGRRGQFGGTLGGPIKKDHTFFFLAYEGFALAQQILPSTTTVPTNAQLAGFIAGSCTSTVSVSGLYDPSHTVTGQLPCTANPNTVATTGGPAYGVYYPTAAPTAWNAPSAKIGQALAAEFPIAQNQSTGLYQMSETRDDNAKTLTGRVDQVFSDKDTVTAEYNLYWEAAFEPSNNLCGSPTIPHFGCYEYQHTQLIGTGWTHTFSPSLLNELRIDYNRMAQVRAGEDAFLSQSEFVDNWQVSAANTGAPHTGGSVDASATGLATIGNANLPQSHTENQFQILDSVSWIKGRHTMKFGVDLHDNISDNYFIDDGRGALAFSSGTLASNAGTGYSSGNTISDMLLGYPATTTFNPGDNKFAGIERLAHFFAQDDWKATPYLTVNIGLRYEITTPVFEAHNQMSTIVTTTHGSVGYTSTGGTAAYTPGNVEACQEQQCGFGRYFNNVPKKNFGPRLGIAWQPFHKETTVVHAGYGLYYGVPPSLNGFLSQYRQLPERLTTTYTSYNYTQLNLAGPQGTGVGLYALVGLDPNFRSVYTQGYSLGVQQQLARNLGLEVTYYGSETHHIMNNQVYNQAVPSGLATINPTTAAATEIGGLNCSGCYKPYPTWGGLTFMHSEGAGYFNSLGVKLQQQVRFGVSYLLGWTYSKAMDNAPAPGDTSNSSSSSPADSTCPKCELGYSDFHQKSRIVFSPVAQLPFGKGKQWLNQGGILTAIVSDWQVSSIVQAQTGRPFSVLNGTYTAAGAQSKCNTEILASYATAAADANCVYANGSLVKSANVNKTLLGSSLDRPNQVVDPNKNAPHNVSTWFNTSAFANANSSYPGTGLPETVPGNARRNAVIGPGFVQWDAAVIKSVPLPREYAMQFRFEAINCLNHPTFLNPLGDSSTGYFGGTQYGQLTQANAARVVQLSGKFFF
jgi:hypothetical protein